MNNLKYDIRFFLSLKLSLIFSTTFEVKILGTIGWKLKHVEAMSIFKDFYFHIDESVFILHINNEYVLDFHKIFIPHRETAHLVSWWQRWSIVWSINVLIWTMKIVTSFEAPHFRYCWGTPASPLVRYSGPSCCTTS